jgi:hypothetical protein
MRHSTPAIAISPSGMRTVVSGGCRYSAIGESL